MGGVDTKIKLNCSISADSRDSATDEGEELSHLLSNARGTESRGADSTELGGLLGAQSKLLADG